MNKKLDKLADAYSDTVEACNHYVPSEIVEDAFKAGYEAAKDAIDPLQNTFCICNEMKDTELHPCPYREDVGNNSEPCCTCCDVCRRECAMDI